MSLPRLIHRTIFSKMSVGYALKRNGCPFLDCSSMVFYRAISSISIYIYVYSTRSFYRSLASNSLRIPWVTETLGKLFHSHEKQHCVGWRWSSHRFHLAYTVRTQVIEPHAVFLSYQVFCQLGT
jgi:hypothetical protein